MSRRWLDSVLGIPPQGPFLSRRELLRLGLTSAAGLLVSASEIRANQLVGQGRRIIVVGAGFAGLACAYELVHAGFEVLLLEARDRVGGRVHSMTDMIPGKSPEAGGEFIGENHPTVISYAAHFRLELIGLHDESEKAPAPKIINGRRLTAAEIVSIRPEIERSLDQLTKKAIPIDAERPWLTPDAKTLDATSTADWLKGLEISALAKELLNAQLTVLNGVPLEQQSLLGNLTQIRGGGLERFWTHSETHRCKNGNDLIARKMMEAIKQKRVSLGTLVQEITVNNKLVNVKTSKGDFFEGEQLVLAVPPSTWPKIRINPALPETLRPQMGQAVKFLSQVRERFWERRENRPSATSYSGTGQTWWGTANQKPSDPREVLISFLSGPLAEKWSNHPAKTRIGDYQAEMAALLPGFKESVDRTILINWLGMSLTAGGYSFPAPGQVTTHGPILSEGLGRLHFAGEHTCYQFVGYMEGALRSGVDAAKRIINPSQTTAPVKTSD